MSLDPIARRHPWLLGAEWETHRLRQLGWLLMPLRAFLGVTFVFASLQKLANPAYLRADSPVSVVAQMKALESSSPIGPLLRLSLHAPTLVGLLIAIGELAVGLGVLTGLWIRLAAVGGMLLSLTFFITVSWATTPYYYGSDIVFVFAWSVFATCGAGGVLSLDAWIASRVTAAPSSTADPDTNRRRVLIGARSAAMLAVFGGVLGGATAAIGRAAGGNRRTTNDALQLTPSDPTTSSAPAASPSATASPSASASPTASSTPTKSASGTALAALSAVPVGQGRKFTDPSSGQPAWVVRPSSSQVVAFSAICTHAGCTVGFDASSLEFVCPCHGGHYNAKTGQVVSGPPPRALPAIPVHVVDNEIRVD
jgi:thiosulfate dehydrogenase [quinone] large subunit